MILENKWKFLFFLGMSHSWIRTVVFFSCSFSTFHISKSFIHHKTDLAINGETVPNKMK